MAWQYIITGIPLKAFNAVAAITNASLNADEQAQLTIFKNVANSSLKTLTLPATSNGVTISGSGRSDGVVAVLDIQIRSVKLEL